MVDVSSWSDERLEEALAQPNTDFPVRGAAKAELTRRQRNYKLERDATRRLHENEIFNSESLREVNRKKFDERMAQENRAHADEVAAQQLKVAARGVWITGLAAFAAIMSAVAAFASVWLSYHSQDVDVSKSPVDRPAKVNSAAP